MVSTFNDSRYRRARLGWRCDSLNCGKSIAVGERYLDYTLTKFRRLRVCMKCSVKRVQHGPAHIRGRYRFDCHAVREQCGEYDED